MPPLPVKHLALAFALLSSACGAKKTCEPDTVAHFAGTAPSPELSVAFLKLGAKACTVAGKANLVLPGSRASATDKLDAVMKDAGFHDVPGRDRAEGSDFVFSYFKAKSDKDGDLVELLVKTGDSCPAGDVCIENRGYSVVPR